MKKIFVTFSTLLIVVVMAVSCKQSSKDVASTWLNNFYHMDYESAKKSSTEDTKKMISQFQQLAGMISDSVKKDMKKIVITVKDAKEKGDTAMVTYTVSTDNPVKELPLKLIKKDGKWLVQFSKNDVMGGSDAADNGADQPMGADTATAPADAAMSDTMKH